MLCEGFKFSSTIEPNKTYVIRQTIGRGAQSVVYFAQNVQTNIGYVHD
jgi:hypothetical protein